MKIKSALAGLLLMVYGLTASAGSATFVFVHGALFTSLSWMAVQSRLQNAGYNVVTMDVPGRAQDGVDPFDVTLSSAVNKLCKVLSQQPKPVILVGHSQGGAVITQALDQCASRIRALVYVAAVAPANGDTVFQDLSKSDNKNFDRCVTYDRDDNVFRVNNSGPLKEMFMADAPVKAAESSIHSMVDEPARIGEAVLHYPEQVFSATPKFYIETRYDKIISFATQEKIVRKIKPQKVYAMNASHSPFLSQPALLAQHLIDIAKLTTKKE